MSEEIEQAVETPEASLEQQIETLSKEVNEDSAPLETTEASVTPAIEAKAEAEEVAEVDEGSEFVETDSPKIQKRINTLVWKAGVSERKAEQLEIENSQLRAAQPAQPQVPTGEPKIEDYDEADFDYNESERMAAYYRDLSRFDTNNALNLQAQQFNQQEAQRKAQVVQQDFNIKEAEYSAKAETYREETSRLPRFSPDVVEELKQMGPKAIHLLSQKLDVAQTLAGANPIQAGKILAELGMRLNKPKPTKAPSAAPKPIETVGGSPGSLSKPIEDMTMAEIAAL